MMKQHAIRATVTALAVGLTLGLAGCGTSNDAGGMGDMDHSASPMSEMPSASPSPSDASPSATTQFNDTDVMFVQGMIPHHEQAVEMSSTLLKKSGITKDTTALAKQIQAAQQPEITAMEGWLTTWGKTLDDGMGGMDHGMGGGMATDAQLKTFDQANGSAAEKMYLTMMTKHHQGAIMMAQSEPKNGRSRDAIELAKNIATSQRAEIATMEKLLAAL